MDLQCGSEKKMSVCANIPAPSASGWLDMNLHEGFVLPRRHFTAPFWLSRILRVGLNKLTRRFRSSLTTETEQWASARQPRSPSFSLRPPVSVTHVLAFCGFVSICFLRKPTVTGSFCEQWESYQQLKRIRDDSTGCILFELAHH